MRRVYSETGRLRKVMVHAPGREVDIITPDGANSLLFEDILFGDEARVEHATLCKVFEKYGAEVFDIQDLLIESLQVAGAPAIFCLLDELKEIEKFSDEVHDHLKKLTVEELGAALIQGIVKEKSNQDLYFYPPVPNLIFARDPVIIAYDKILASSMAEPVRQREAKLMTFIFSYHKDHRDQESIIDLSQLKAGDSNITLEGGDFLILDEKTVAIAWSKRTTIEAIKVLAVELKKLGVENLIVVKLPYKTAFIHLDTTFTRISNDECLIYPPLYAKESENRSEIFYFDLSKKNLLEKKYDYIFDLFKDLKMPLKPVYCGGKNSIINQIREQWTQGANAFCIAPGVILTYSRNVETVQELADAGYLCISAEEVIKPYFNVDINRKTVILLKGDELCRARGGPRCLTHPLLREA